MVELSCHGNPIIVDSIIKRACSFGARIADPGEFTKRAFLNNKIDLVQAEAVGDLINSRSEEAALHQNKNLSGSVSSKIFDKVKRIAVLVCLMKKLIVRDDESQLPTSF